MHTSLLVYEKPAHRLCIHIDPELRIHSLGIVSIIIISIIIVSSSIIIGSSIISILVVILIISITKNVDASSRLHGWTIIPFVCFNH